MIQLPYTNDLIQVCKEYAYLLININNYIQRP